MTNPLQMQAQTITISAPVSLTFDKQLRLAVAERDLPSKAAAIRQALQHWLSATLCPQCDTPTIPDPHRPGVRYCPHCQEPVIYTQPTATADVLLT